MKRYLLLLAFLWCGAVHAAPLLVGHTAHNQAASSTNAVAYTATANNNLVVLVNVSGAPVSASITNTLGYTWHTAFAVATGSGNAYLAAFYAENVSGGADTITVTFGASANSNVYVAEYSGLADASSLDAVSTIKGAFSSSLSSNSVTPSAVGELAILFGGDGGTGVTYSGITGGFTVQDASLESKAPSSFWGDQVAGAGAVSGGATVSASTNWSAIVLLFKASGGGSSCTHSAWLSNGTIAVPTAGSTSVWRKDGNFGTVDCSTTQYYQPTNAGAFGVN